MNEFQSSREDLIGHALNKMCANLASWIKHEAILELVAGNSLSDFYTNEFAVNNQFTSSESALIKNTTKVREGSWKGENFWNWRCAIPA